MNQSQSQLNYISHFQENPIRAIRELTYYQREVFKCLTYLQAKYFTVWASQKKIAKIVGCTIRHVNRCIRDLVSMGYIVKDYQAYLTCTYRIANHLKTNSVIVLLKSYIPALKYFYSRITLPISMLFSSSPKHAPDRQCPTNNTSYIDLSISYLAASSKKEGAGACAGAAGLGSSKIDENKGEDSEFRALCDELLRKAELREQESVTKCHDLKKAAANGRTEVRTEAVTHKKESIGPMTGEACYYYNKKKLTLKGRIEFSCFEELVIREAFATLNERTYSDIKSPLSWLLAYCKRVSLERQLPIDLALKKKMYNSMGEVGMQDTWEDATNAEIFAHNKKSSGKESSSYSKYKNIKHTQKPEEKTLKRESWNSYSRPEDIPVTIYLTPEEVLKNVQTLESAPMHKGINFREVFAKELVEGETIVTTEREIREKKKALEDLGLPVDGSLVSHAQGRGSESGSNTTNEKVSGNVNGREEEEKFVRVDPGSGEGHSARSVMAGFQSMGHVMGTILRDGAAAKSRRDELGGPATPTASESAAEEDELRNARSFRGEYRAFTTCNPHQPPDDSSAMGTYYEDNGQVHGDVQIDWTS
jgi:hypothetical protein